MIGMGREGKLLSLKVPRVVAIFGTIGGPLARSVYLVLLVVQRT